MPDDARLPEIDPAAQLPALPPVARMPMAMAIWFDDRIFDRARVIAGYLAKAEGFVPPHLIGKNEACFAVVERSLTWKLSPYAVAQSTYQTPGGKVGFEGKLCQAILENSGKIEGGVKYEFFGDWEKIRGKFKIVKSDRGKDVAVRTWDANDAKGLGVIVRAKVVGESEPREWRFDLAQAFPLNSTLWATDPQTQICYAAVRRFGSVAAPGIFMGVPFDHDDTMDRAEFAKDVTPPRPKRHEEQPSIAEREFQEAVERGEASSESAVETADEAETAQAAEAVVEAESAQEEAAKRDEFWSGAKLEVRLPMKGKVAEWGLWNVQFRDWLKAAEAENEVFRLHDDNERHLGNYQLANPEAAKALKAAIHSRAAELHRD